MITISAPEYKRSIFKLNKLGKDKSFLFTTEIELQQWLVPILAVIYRNDQSKESPLEGGSRMSLDAKKIAAAGNMRSKQARRVRRDLLLSDVGADCEGNSCLHVLAALQPTEAATDAILMLASWLIHNGSDVSRVNTKGALPLDGPQGLTWRALTLYGVL